MENKQRTLENSVKTLELQYIKGVGPKRAEALAASGIFRDKDVASYFPRAYVSHDAVSSLKALAVSLRKETNSLEMFTRTYSPNREITVLGKVSAVSEHSFGKNKKVLTVSISDFSGGVAQIVFWQYHDFYKKSLPVGQMLIVSGKVELDKWGKINFHHPEISKIEEDEEVEFKSGAILPVYKITDNMRSIGINIRLIRKIVSSILPNYLPKIRETLPDYILKKYKLLPLSDSFKKLHFPGSQEDIEHAQFRMKFQEIFYFELFLALRQNGVKVKEKGLKLNPKSAHARSLYDSLPFELTGDQKKAIREISNDMASGNPMNRLLQGDVGSGKTIVAILIMLAAIDNGLQVAFMAPTEILAEQHFSTLKNLLQGTDINVVQLLGGTRAKMKREKLEQIKIGSANVIVGTHALFQEALEYKNLGFVIIDEQHRFGVAQRAELKKLASRSFGGEEISPHILVMTATPIPRTLSMTLYGDLDVSIIREMPKNRKPIRTHVLFESQLDEVFEFIRREVKAGRQAYIVYPLVEKSEKLELKAAVENYEILKEDVFPDFSCGLLHGQMLWYEKEEVMKSFLNKEYQILVATTIIEVGIDVANASIMLIQDAHRFGLSQLHQLRGRVGRGQDQSWCYLATKEHYKFEFNKKGVPDEEQANALVRLKTMESTTDGFKIAETDLKLRGPGDFLGTRQSGLPSFKFLDLVGDGDIISLARKEAFSIVADDPQLRKPENIILLNEYKRLYSDESNYYEIA